MKALQRVDFRVGLATPTPADDDEPAAVTFCHEFHFSSPLNRYVGSKDDAGIAFVLVDQDEAQVLDQVGETVDLFCC
jgi:hypothetical protein